jgi:hypothetical protein
MNGLPELDDLLEAEEDSDGFFADMIALDLVEEWRSCFAHPISKGSSPQSPADNPV